MHLMQQPREAGRGCGDFRRVSRGAQTNRTEAFELCPLSLTMNMRDAPGRDAVE